MSEMVDRLVDRLLDVMLERCLNANAGDARAILTAMREPTEAMVLAACNRPDADDDNRVGIWRAMIDEALRE